MRLLNPFTSSAAPASAALLASLLTVPPAVVPGQAQMIGINVLLNQAPDHAVLAELAAHGQVLDVIPEIRAVTLRAHAGELEAIQMLPCVAAANHDARRQPQRMVGAPVPDFSHGSNQWSLDAINVTDAGAGRTIGYDGEGVYIAVLDSGLAHNWREYFPEDRIDTVHARSFGGGGGAQGTVSSQPNLWEHDTTGHGTAVTSILLGFQYALSDPELPDTFNGVAPRATVIPIKNDPNGGEGFTIWSSTAGRSIVYVANLKASGELGDSPVVINMSQGGFGPDALELAAVDYAIESGIVFLAAAGNDAAVGMRYPGAYAPVISCAATGPVGQFPLDDPTSVQWILGDVPEADEAAHYVAPFSAWELAGQDLDVAAPGYPVPVVWAYQQGQLDYSFFSGTSAATPHIAGIAALMLQKNPNLTTAEIESLLETTAMPLPPGCRNVIEAGVGPGNAPTWSDHGNVYFFGMTYCWEAYTSGAGLVDAEAALAATPWP